eukprot:Awhi_evm1s6431
MNARYAGRLDTSKIFRIVELEPDLACNSSESRYDVQCVLKNVIKKYSSFSLISNGFFQPTITFDISKLQNEIKKFRCGAVPQGKKVWNVIVIKNEVDTLLQHIHYHLLRGVSHFLIYDNESYANLEKTLKRSLQNLIEAGYVTLFHRRGKGMQQRLFSEGVKLAEAAGVEWLIVGDCDEFLILKDNQCIPNYLDQFKEKDLSAVSFQWIMLIRKTPLKTDSSHLLGNIQNTKMEGFQYNPCLKTIVKPERIVKVPHPHYAVPSKGYFQYNSQHEKTDYLNPCPQVWGFDSFIIHVYVQSIEHLNEKRLRGRADAPVSPEPLTIEEALSSLNELFKDTSPANGFLKPYAFELIRNISQSWSRTIVLNYDLDLILPFFFVEESSGN